MPRFVGLRTLPRIRQACRCISLQFRGAPKIQKILSPSVGGGGGGLGHSSGGEVSRYRKVGAGNGNSDNNHTHRLSTVMVQMRENGNDDDVVVVGTFSVVVVNGVAEAT